MITPELLDERAAKIAALIVKQRSIVDRESTKLHEMWNLYELIKDGQRLLVEGKPLPAKWFLGKLEEINTKFNGQ